jgi:hypothetical protein
MKTNRSYWQIVNSSIAVVVSLALVACGGSSSSGVDPNTLSSISSFSIQGAPGIINQDTKTIAITLPFGTPVTALVANFTTTGSIVTVGSSPAVTQVSGTTANNFTAPVAYVVTAVNGTATTYTVTVTVAVNSAKAITSYSLGGITGVINEAAKTIRVAMPFGTNVTALVATFTTTGSTVTVGSGPAVAQVSGTTANDFTSAVVYLVTAGNATTVSYTVTVTVGSNSAKAITSYSLNGVVGVIKQPTFAPNPVTAGTISVVMPFGTDVTALVATFSTTGSTVTIGSGPAVTQVSGTTPNNFTSPVIYDVTAIDTTAVAYTVTVTVAGSTSATLNSYSLDGITGVIKQPVAPSTAGSIRVVMPFGTDVTALVATFTKTGTGVTVDVPPVTAQISGITRNNFTAPVVYVVTPNTGATASYTVTVTAGGAGPAPVALGDAGNYALFSNTALVADAGLITRVVGDIGVGPGVTSTAITTGFDPLIPDPVTGAFARSGIVTGKVYASNYASPTPTYIISSSNDMGTAYDDAAGRTPVPANTNLYLSELGGRTFLPGIYTWTGGLNLATATDVTLDGGPNDVWIMQVATALTTGAQSRVVLTGGAVPENVFWVFGTSLTVGARTGAPSGFEGIVLAGTTITVGANAIINGRLLAKTGITLNANTVTQPAN